MDAGAKVTTTVYSDSDMARVTSLHDPHNQLQSIKTDIFDAAERTKLFDDAETFGGPLWGLVNVVGGYTGGTRVHETTLEDVRRMWQLNVESAFLCAQEALTRLTNAERPGRVVTISSAAAERGDQEHFAYIATKSAVLRLTETAAEEYKHLGITINAVQPGMIATEANRDAMPDADQSLWVTPDQVAHVISFLLTPHASGVNGAHIRVTGRG